MTIELATTNNFEFKNAKLRKYTEQIFKQGLNIKKAYARIAVSLAGIEESKCYEMDNFESVADYAEKILGIKYAQTRAMIRVGRDFLDSRTLESVLPHNDGEDYSTSQLQALLPLNSVDKAEEMANASKISPEMTVKEIKEAVKAEMGKDTVIDIEPVKETEIEPETVETNAYVMEWSFEFGHDSENKPVIICGDKTLTLEQAIHDLTAWHDSF